MSTWVDKARLYREPQVLSILFLGFSSGLPFLLTLATLHVWLSERGASKTTIGLFVLITLPYALKFLWAPLLDRRPFPVFSALFGHRKGWLLGSQIGVILSLIALGSSDPQDNIVLTAVLALFVAFFSSTQDVTYEAFRVERLSGELMGPGAGASSFGYRLGMWVAGAGALYLASFFSWFVVYFFMACTMVIGLIATLLSYEPVSKAHPVDENFKQFVTKSMASLLKRSDLSVLLTFIFLYKIGDTILNTMAMPFLLEIGFSKLEIAHVAKAFGLFTMMVGGLMGGLFLATQSLSQVLLWVATMQFFASMMFMIQAYAGYNLGLLFLTIGLENFTCGLGTAAFIVLLSSRCQKPFIGTHFALLTSFSSLSRVVISMFAGWTADHFSWVPFYGLTACLTIPCFMLIWINSSKFYGTQQSSLAPS